jgi:hypothetical protein
MIELSSLSGITATSGAASGADAAASVRAGGAALLDALTGGNPIGTPLREIALQIAGVVSDGLANAGGPVGAAQLERAVLDFGREAKAFAIGHADRGGENVRAALDDALLGGAADAHRLAATASFTAVDHASLVFENAAARLQAN